MKQILKIIIINILIIIFFTYSLYAWRSEIAEIGLSTHYAITEKAISLLSDAEYPDIKKYFKDDIINWSSGLTNDAGAHGKYSDPEIFYVGNPDAIKFNGGPFPKWWYGVTEKYTKFNFLGDKSAYYYIGLMCHLVEDQCVPPHAANVSHGITDKFENEAWIQRPSGGMVYNIDIDPTYYYFNDKRPRVSPIRYTQSQLPYWKYPSNGFFEEYRGLQFWIENTNSTWKYSGQSFFPDPEKAKDDALKGWGRYGGPALLFGGYTDIYIYMDLDKKSADIIPDQLNEAVSFTAGMLMAVSKSLPPLVKDLKIASASAGVPKIDLVVGNKISFKILENRTQKVNIYITIDEPFVIPPQMGVPPSPDYFSDKLVKIDIDFELQPSTESNDLPWKGEYSFTWDGKLRNGKFPTDGEHTLYVLVQDKDFNESPAASDEFIISVPYLEKIDVVQMRLGKTGYYWDTDNPIYRGEWGEPQYLNGIWKRELTIIPEENKRKIIRDIAARVNLRFSDNMGGVDVSLDRYW
ncbi:MAG: hypothetical protein HY934_05675 [Candidatus Firestonebacteria bacterium]|nr:hypothetical protein [Candidatus Firestonebacteria bacterium]